MEIILVIMILCVCFLMKSLNFICLGPHFKIISRRECGCRTFFCLGYADLDIRAI